MIASLLILTTVSYEYSTNWGNYMLAELLVRYAHFSGILLFTSGLVVQVFLLKSEVAIAQFRHIINADKLCGISILIVLVSGLLLWFVVGKPSTFYSMNWVFHLKLVSFGLIFILAIKPILFFSKLNKTESAISNIPNLVITLVRAQLFILIFVPFLAVLMAKGYGLT